MPIAIGMIDSERSEESHHVQGKLCEQSTRDSSVAALPQNDKDRDKKQKQRIGLSPDKSAVGNLCQAHSLKQSRINILVGVFGQILNYDVCHLEQFIPLSISQIFYQSFHPCPQQDLLLQRNSL